MRTHRLKTWPSFWHAVARGDKTFEVRRNDRDFAVGDTLVLLYFDPSADGFGRQVAPNRWERVGEVAADAVRVRVTYVMQGGQWGIAPDMCVLGFRRDDGD